LSIRRPTRETIRSMMAVVTSSLTNRLPEFSSTPFFSTKIRSRSTTMISLMIGERSRSSSGP